MYLVKNSVAIEFSDEASPSSKIILALKSLAVVLRSFSAGKMRSRTHGHFTIYDCRHTFSMTNKRSIVNVQKSIVGTGGVVSLLFTFCDFIKLEFVLQADVVQHESLNDYPRLRLFTRFRVGHRPGSLQRRILRLHEPGLCECWVDLG